jgi:hypothetical protein
VEKPKDLTTYKDWLRNAHGVELSDRTSTHYDAVSAKIKKDFENSSFWQDVKRQLINFDGEYRLQDNYPLLMDQDPPSVLVKPYTSLVTKSYRRNCLDNSAWPDPPPDGWCLPGNWFELTNDVVRTSFVVKYLDGVSFLGERIHQIAIDRGVDGELSYEARMEGYYAGHVVTRHKVDIPKQNWDTEPVTTSVEIQITTQLQEVIRKLLHRYYEKRRLGTSDKQDWQWDFRSDEFVANNLGHILHYVEGMIMEVRERQHHAPQTEVKA